MRTRLISIAIWVGLAAMSLSETPPKQTVVFLCEHGSAKSVIAATHFNRIAGSKVCRTEPSAEECARILNCPTTSDRVYWLTAFRVICRNLNS